MFNGLLKNKWLTGGFALALALVIGYYFYNGSSSSALLTTSDAATSPLSQGILTTLGQLHTIKLDPALFNDPSFISLTDFGVTIPPQAAGRRNPFAPIGAAESAAAAPAAKPAVH